MNKVTTPFLNEEEKAMANKKKIVAIKMYRERTGASLNDSKEEVERYLFNPNLYDKERRISEGMPSFNHSSYDAYMRILNARSGSFIDAHEEYLVALEKYLKDWHKVTISELMRLRKDKRIAKGEAEDITSSELLQRALNQKRRYTHRDLQTLARGIKNQLKRRYGKKLVSFSKWKCVMRETEVVLSLRYILQRGESVIDQEEHEYRITL